MAVERRRLEPITLKFFEGKLIPTPLPIIESTVPGALRGE